MCDLAAKNFQYMWKRNSKIRQEEKKPLQTNLVICGRRKVGPKHGWLVHGAQAALGSYGSGRSFAVDVSVVVLVLAPPQIELVEVHPTNRGSIGDEVSFTNAQLATRVVNTGKSARNKNLRPSVCIEMALRQNRAKQFIPENGVRVSERQGIFG